jgi:NAD(P)-dependent dehydrogenase (short-subunit alcohol dehydrogenase family)
MSRTLAGRKAIVTGAGLGIGRAIALRLADEGCDVGLFDRDAGSADATAAMVRAKGRRAVIALGDASRPDDVAAGTAALVQALDGVDILVNNAGILRTAPFMETPYAMWREVFSVNLDGAFLFSQAILPVMVEQKSGCVVNMASWTGKKGVPNHSAYSASKFALIGLTQSLAGEMAGHGIRVNAVCPGVIVNTRMRDVAEELNRAQGLPDVNARVQNTIPLKRAGEPHDVAGVVAFLCSDDASYMTGQAVNITGGLWMS